MSDETAKVVYSYQEMISIPHPDYHDRRFFDMMSAINNALGWSPAICSSDDRPDVKEAHRTAMMCQSVIVTIDVYADGNRRIRGT